MVYTVRRRVESVIDGIDVSDKHLSEKFESEPRCYGNARLSEEERTLLKLSPKYAIYERPDVVDLEVEIEKEITKYRWSRMDDAEFVENFGSDIEEDLDTSVNVSRSRVLSRRRSRNVSASTPNADSRHRLRSSVSERNGANDS